MISCIAMACIPVASSALRFCCSMLVFQRIMLLTSISWYLWPFVLWHNHFVGDLILQYKVTVVAALLTTLLVFQCPFYFKAGFAMIYALITYPTRIKAARWHFLSDQTLWLPSNINCLHVWHMTIICFFTRWFMAYSMVLQIKCLNINLKSLHLLKNYVDMGFQYKMQFILRIFFLMLWRDTSLVCLPMKAIWLLRLFICHDSKATKIVTTNNAPRRNFRKYPPLPGNQQFETI
jgi:hypothetical protein